VKTHGKTPIKKAKLCASPTYIVIFVLTADVVTGIVSQMAVLVKAPRMYRHLLLNFWYKRSEEVGGR
jgi:hypothetical protein